MPGAKVGAQHDVGIEQGHEGVEIASTSRQEEGVDNSALAREVGVRGRYVGALHSPQCPAGELPRRCRGATNHGGNLLERQLEHVKAGASPILVTGGTGTLGRLVVPQLRDAGCAVRVLSRCGHEAREGIAFVAGDLATCEGIAAAVEGAEIIVHCAGSSKGDEEKTLHLVRAATRAGARHVVYISVVGADRIPVVSRVDRAMFGYFASKLAAERVVADSGLPWTTLRATQFHVLSLLTARQMARLPVLPVAAGFRFQPVDAGEVAARLVELALSAPAGLVPDMAGPRVYGMDELLRGYLRASRKRRPIVPVRLPGRAARAIRAGANLAPDRAVGRRTWEEFLAERVSSSSDSRSRGASGH